MQTHCFLTFCCSSYFNLSSTYKYSLLLLFCSAADNCTLPFSDSHISYSLWSFLLQPLHYIKVLGKNLQTLLRFQFALLCSSLTPYVINCLCLDNSGSLYCKIVQPNFDCTDANTLKTAEAFKLQSQTVIWGKLPSPLTLCSIHFFMIFHALSLNFLNLKVSILQSSCRVHNSFIQFSC